MIPAKVNIEEIQRIVRSASKIPLQSFRSKDLQVEQKGDDGPVTRIDRETEAFLREHLMALDPDAGWLAEENNSAKGSDNDRLNRKRCWIVDPIDGTTNLIAGSPNFATVVGYAQYGKVTHAAVFEAARDRMFVAQRGCGALLNGVLIRQSKRASWLGASVCVSRSAMNKGSFDGYPNQHLFNFGSCALEICLVAAGAIEASVVRNPAVHEWDIAAPSLILEEAGGVIRTLQNKPFRFNQRDPRVGGQICASARHIENAVRTFL